MDTARRWIWKCIRGVLDKMKDGENGAYVYFIRDTLGHIKIGVTINVRNRINQLQTANPMKLEFYYGMHVKSIDDAAIIEKELHDKFKDFRLNGEWFKENEIITWLNQPWLEAGNYKFEGANWKPKS